MFCFAKQKLLITSANTAYLVTAFIQKPPPIFASATLRQTSDMPKRCTKSTRSARRFARYDFAQRARLTSRCRTLSTPLRFVDIVQQLLI